MSFRASPYVLEIAAVVVHSATVSARNRCCRFGLGQAIPETVQGVILARLDKLPDRHRGSCDLPHERDMVRYGRLRRASSIAPMAPSAAPAARPPPSAQRTQMGGGGGGGGLKQ